ncbi:hypothetical protein SDC9_153922 [bioreactor metagenome]|uniref:Uncharacterized protein n=1 Tax=bioreactor metagenome TaxID=1076179 RepID=A0A645EZ04_9ZZZZ
MRAPVAIHPDVGLHIADVGVHAQPHLHIGADGAAVVHALRAGIAHPQIGRRGAHINRRRAEDAQHQRRLHHQQHTRKSHGEDRRHKTAPFVGQRLAGKRDHGVASLSAGSAGSGAPPSALYSVT